MDSIANKNISYGLGLIFIVIILTIPDLLISLAIDFFHFVWELVVELAHMLFEGIETVLDNLVEELLHTELHQTQVIVFYMMMIFIWPIIYFLLRLLLRKTIRLKNDLNVLVTSYDPYQFSLYWDSISIQKKIGLFLGALSSIYLASFFFM
jgi:hypothetical protein